MDVLDRISLFAAKTLRLLPAALMTLGLIAVVIGMRPPDTGGGTGV